MVEGLGRGIVALGGQWQFHLGDDAEWSLPNLDDTGWERLLVDRPWGDQGHYGYTGFAWYRRHLDFVQSTASPVELVLYMLGHPKQGVLVIRTWTAPLDSASSGDDRG